MTLKVLYAVMVAWLVLPSMGCIPQKNLHEAAPFCEVPESCRQMIIIKPAAGGVSKAYGFAWERTGESWVEREGGISCSVGRNGFARIGQKIEGDGKTPSGIYPIGLAFGYAPTLDTKLQYRPLKDDDFWIDDPKSPDYNTWVSGPKPAVSHEILRRSDIAYKIGAVIEYNTHPIVAGKGSAIYLHVINPGPDPKTAGCVALDEAILARWLAWLDSEKHPHIVLNYPEHTADFYDASLAEPKAK